MYVLDDTIALLRKTLDNPGNPRNGVIQYRECYAVTTSFTREATDIPLSLAQEMLASIHVDKIHYGASTTRYHVLPWPYKSRSDLLVERIHEALPMLKDRVHYVRYRGSVVLQPSELRYLLSDPRCSAVLVGQAIAQVARDNGARYASYTHPDKETPRKGWLLPEKWLTADV